MVPTVSEDGFCADSLREVSAALSVWAIDSRLSIMTRLKLSDDAVAMAMRSVRSALTDHLAWLRLAQAYAVIGKWEASERCLDRARELTTDGDLLALFPRWD